MLRRVALGVMVMSIIVAGCVSDPTQSDEYLQLESQKSDVESELAAAQDAAGEAAEAATAAATDIAALQADVNRLEEESAEANGNLVAGSDALTRLTSAIETVIALDMWIPPEDLEESRSVGVDTSVGDQIIADKEWGASWDIYGGSQGSFEIDILVADMGDQALEASWLAFLDSPIGSDEERLQLDTFLLRLWELTFERLDETAAALPAQP